MKRLFNFNILTDKELTELKISYINEAFDSDRNYLEDHGVVRELNRLRSDHWDKDAFDRIITIILGM